MLKKTKSNKKTIAIVVLAVLLVALLAFNVTYAYFTDKVSGTGQLQFGLVDINTTAAPGMAASTNANTGAAIMPGDTIKLSGTISTSEADTADKVWMKFSVANLKMYYGEKSEGTEIDTNNSKNQTNAYFDDDKTDTTGHLYTGEDYTAMKTKLEGQIMNKFIAAFNTAFDGNKLGTVDESTAHAKGVTDKVVEKGTSFNLNGVTFTLDKTALGNLFQNVVFAFDIVVQAVQATEVANPEAADAIFKAGTFNTGLTA